MERPDNLTRKASFRVARLLISNAFLFFLASALLLSVLYAAGNAQSFSLETLFLLLMLLYWNGIVLFVFAILSIFLETIIYLLRRGVHSFSHIVLYAIFACLGLIITAFSGGLIALSKGKSI